MNGVYIVSLVVLVVIAVYLGHEVYKVLKKDREEEKKREKEIEEAILTWMDNPTSENKASVDELVEKYRIEREK